MSRLRAASAFVAAVATTAWLYAIIHQVTRAGDLRFAQALLIAAGVATLVSIAGRWQRWTNVAAMAVLSIFILASILVLTGSGRYWEARSAVWRGDYAAARELLSSTLAANQGSAVVVRVPGGTTVACSRTGILCASEAELWFGLARCYEYEGDNNEALRAYRTALRSSEGVWTTQRRSEVAQESEALEAKTLKPR